MNITPEKMITDATYAKDGTTEPITARLFVAMMKGKILFIFYYKFLMVCYS